MISDLVAAGGQGAEVRARGAGSTTLGGMTASAGKLLVLEEELLALTGIGQMAEGKLTQRGNGDGRRRWGRTIRSCDLRILRAAEGLQGLVRSAAERGVRVDGGLTIHELGPGIGHHAERGDGVRAQLPVVLVRLSGLDQPRDGLAQLENAGRHHGRLANVRGGIVETGQDKLPDLGGQRPVHVHAHQRGRPDQRPGALEEGRHVVRRQDAIAGQWRQGTSHQGSRGPSGRRAPQGEHGPQSGLENEPGHRVPRRGPARASANRRPGWSAVAPTRRRS